MQFLENAFPGSNKLGLCYHRAKVIFLNNAVVYYDVVSYLFINANKRVNLRELQCLCQPESNYNSNLTHRPGNPRHSLY